MRVSPTPFFFFYILFYLFLHLRVNNSHQLVNFGQFFKNFNQGSIPLLLPHKLHILFFKEIYWCVVEGISKVENPKILIIE